MADTRPPLHFPPARLDTSDGVRQLAADMRAIVRQLEPPTHSPQLKSTIDDAVGRLWYQLTRSQEARPRSGYYTTILPRLLRVQSRSAASESKDRPVLCSGRIVLQLSNPEFIPSLVSFGFETPAHPARRECTATLSVIDLTHVRHIPASPTAVTNPSDLGSYFQWAITEFNSTFFDHIANSNNTPQPHTPTNFSAV